ncbi:hypothetical protein [Candidatus Berkiella aquae]|uniref:Porin domain-containing protein n=1 Tax=Candidatus Berkiella aquae TaxID=295108 RepID=A0A0Q9YNW7_9GAMM|nr:hypothetical protein [Candidatus Berkiella aquae]MCS5711660.1 hypothetical protein [Candidatus Berkiella aquae]
MKKSLTALLASMVATNAFAMVGDIQINGFLSAAVAWSTVDYLNTGVEPIYVSYIGKRPSWEKDTNIGIQLTKYLREDVSITTQFFAEGSRDFDVVAPWAFIKWEPNDRWQFRAGRMRTQTYMLSDYVNVGYAYPWIRPPQEVYSQIPASFSNVTGVDARYRMELWGQDLTLTGFYGATNAELTFPIPPGNTILDLIRVRLRDLYVINLRYGDETFSIRAGYEGTRVTLTPNAGTVMEGLNVAMDTLVGFGILGPDYINYFSAYGIDASFKGIGYQFDWNNFVSMGELVKRHAGTPIIADVIGWYLMGGYRFNELLPHITFARERLADNYTRRFNSTANMIATLPPAFGGLGLSSNFNQIAQALIGTSVFFDGGAGEQTSVTIGLRWDVYEGIAIKGEYCHVHPDRYSPGLFDALPHKSVNIYSLAVDAVM